MQPPHHLRPRNRPRVQIRVLPARCLAVASVAGITSVIGRAVSALTNSASH